MKICNKKLAILQQFLAIFLLLLLFHTPSLFSFGSALPAVPIKDVQAEYIDFQDNKLKLTGNVRVTYDLGVITCNSAIVYIDEKTKNEKKKDNGGSSIDKIDLIEAVQIEFTDGSILQAEKGEILCQIKEAHFYGSVANKVIYTSFCEENGVKIPIVAKGKKITARITQDALGKSTLSDIRGEGSVSIEYVRQAEL